MVREVILMSGKLILFPDNTEEKTTRNANVKLVPLAKNQRIIPFTGGQGEFNKHLANRNTKIPYKGYYIYTEYRENEYLVMSCLNRKILLEIIPYGNNVMNSYIIAEYLMDKEEFDELLTTVEWSSNPERRIQELANKNNSGKIINLKLYRNNEAQNIMSFSNYDDGNVKTKKMAS
jgi:hypothetical protein